MQRFEQRTGIRPKFFIFSRFTPKSAFEKPPLVFLFVSVKVDSSSESSDEYSPLLDFRSSASIDWLLVLGFDSDTDCSAEFAGSKVLSMVGPCLLDPPDFSNSSSNFGLFGWGSLNHEPFL